MPLHSFLVIYRRDEMPIQIVAVLRGWRDVERILRERLRLMKLMNSKQNAW